MVDSYIVIVVSCTMMEKNAGIVHTQVMIGMVHPENRFNWGYAGHSWENHEGNDYLVHHYQEINPKTIRFNIGMPNHLVAWRRDVYNKVRGHNRNISVADDFELIVKTFLETKFIHIKKMLYLQYNNRNSTVDNKCD